jgi:hypothetical protein
MTVSARKPCARILPHSAPSVAMQTGYNRYERITIHLGSDRQGSDALGHPEFLDGGDDRRNIGKRRGASTLRHDAMVWWR